MELWFPVSSLGSLGFRVEDLLGSLGFRVYGEEGAKACLASGRLNCRKMKSCNVRLSITKKHSFANLSRFGFWLRRSVRNRKT